jgi:putative addiction module component (TIGR02574 family)
VADPVRQIEADALKLTPKQRARIAERLLSSLDDGFDPENDRLWLEEAERRLDELLSGEVKGVPAEQVFKKARSALR